MKANPKRNSNYINSFPRFQYLGLSGIIIFVFSCAGARTGRAILAAPNDRLTIERVETMPAREVYRFDKCRIEAGRGDPALARIATTRDNTEVVVERTRDGGRIELFACTRGINSTNANDWIRYVRTVGSSNITVERGGFRNAQIQENVEVASRRASSFLIDFVSAEKIVLR
ncbi:MAG: hypothetical protein ACKVS6_10615 [Planctomycetota bacterium]